MEGLAPRVKLAVCDAVAVPQALSVDDGVSEALGVPLALDVGVGVAEGVVDCEALAACMSLSLVAGDFTRLREFAPAAGEPAGGPGALAEQREATGDFGLDDTLNWAEVRVAVEAAKLERANEPA